MAARSADHGSDGKSTGNQCGGMPLPSDCGRARAVELGLDEVHGAMVLVPRSTGAMVLVPVAPARTQLESPHAAATPMMARRVRKWTVRCPAAGTLSTTVVFCSVSASFFGLSLVVLVVLV